MLERVIGGIDHVERKIKKGFFTIHENIGILRFTENKKKPFGISWFTTNRTNPVNE